MNIFGTEFDYATRQDKLRKVMQKLDLDAIIIHNWTNQYYYGGHYQHLPWYPVSHTHITESPLILFRDHHPVFLAAFITMNAVREGTWIKDVRVIDQGFAKNAVDGIAKVMEERGLAAGNIAIEEQCCTASTYDRLRKALPKATIRFAGDEPMIARSVKTPDEIALMKVAIEICESAIAVAKEMAQPGVIEMDVQLAMEIEMKRHGAMREVETMCQSGKRTANYRAFAADWKKIEDGDLLTVDLGCLYKGYGCDIARTWCVGTPDPRFQKISDDLERLAGKFLEFLKPGMVFGDVFDHMKGLMVEMGYPATKTSFPCQQFTIHGVGLGPFHDFPHPTHRETVFEPGMVISYQAGVRDTDFSMRFEDNILITETGLEMLSHVPRGLTWDPAASRKELVSA